MRDTYALYEAKAKLSAIIRQVREGRRVVVTVHGKPVAEIRPVEREADTLAARVERSWRSPRDEAWSAACWHLASALYLAEDPGAISFLTLDERAGGRREGARVPVLNLRE